MEDAPNRLAAEAVISTEGAEDDAALATRATAGDAEAFGALYDRYVDAVYRYVYYRVRNEAEAEDVTSQVFFKALRAMPRYRPRQPFLAWLYRIARRVDELSRAATRPERAPTATAEYEAAVDRLAKAVEALRGTPTREDKREAVGEVVEAAREKHVQVLEELRHRLPYAARPGIDRAIEQTEKLRHGPGPRPAGAEQPAPADRSRPTSPSGPRATPRGER